MTEGNDKDQKVAVVNFVNDAVDAHSDPHRNSAGKLHTSVMPRVVCEPPNRFNNPKLDLAINLRELLLGAAEGCGKRVRTFSGKTLRQMEAMQSN